MLKCGNSLFTVFLLYQYFEVKTNTTNLFDPWTASMSTSKIDGESSSSFFYRENSRTPKTDRKGRGAAAPALGRAVFQAGAAAGSTAVAPCPAQGHACRATAPAPHHLGTYTG